MLNSIKSKYGKKDEEGKIILASTPKLFWISLMIQKWIGKYKIQSYEGEKKTDKFSEGPIKEKDNR